MSDDQITLGPTSYGKSGVRIVKVVRDGPRHQIHDFTVDVALEGDFADCYERGDNRAMPATDTMRNIVYALAKRHSFDGPEAFGLALAHHYLSAGPTIARVTVRLTAFPWGRITAGDEGHDHAFVRESGERTCVVTTAADGTSVSAGIDNTLILKTTASGWSDFHRDEYTTLPDADDRILATVLTAEWRYRAGDDLNYSALWPAVRSRILTSFADHYSPSVQHTLYRMGRAVLAEFAAVERIRFRLPNKHHLLFNLAPFGLDNPGEIFHVTNEPYGLIEGVVERR